MELKWPRRLVVVRHGQSEQNAALDLLEPGLDEVLAAQKDIRDADIKLTDLGVRQAQQTGMHLASTEPFDMCYSSPYRRAVHTAEEIVANLCYELRIRQDERLREKEFGRLHGFSTEEIREFHPEEYRIRERDGKYWYRLPGGENYPDVRERVHSFLGKLNRDHAGESILVVTHQVPYKLFRALFEYLNEPEVLTLPDTPNCGIMEFLIDTSERESGKLKVARFNDVAYPTE